MSERALVNSVGQNNITLIFLNLMANPTCNQQIELNFQKEFFLKKGNSFNKNLMK